MQWLKGVWLPAEILANRKLSYTEMILFCLIELLDNGERGCYASNKYFADLLGVTTQTISNGISNLRELDYLKTSFHNFNGRAGRDIQINENYKKIYNQSISKFISRLEKNLNRRSTNSIRDKESRIIVSKETKSRKARHKLLPSNETPPNKKRPAKEILPKRKSKMYYSEVSAEAAKVLSHWNDISTNTSHKTSSKLVQRTFYSLDKDILPKHPLSNIIKAIDRLQEMKENRKYYKEGPPNKLSIDVFFLGSKFYEKVWFKKIVNENYLSCLKMSDRYPEISEELKKLYRKHVTCQDNTVFTSKQETDFRKAAVKVNEIIETGRLNKYIVNAAMPDYVRHLFISLADRYEHSGSIEVGHLCSSNTWNIVWPKYITRTWL